MDDVPFFDVHLPYELAINIFQYLNRRELGLCAQVSCCSPVFQGPQLCPHSGSADPHSDRSDELHSSFLKEGRPEPQVLVPHSRLVPVFW